MSKNVSTVGPKCVRTLVLILVPYYILSSVLFTRESWLFRYIE